VSARPGGTGVPVAARRWTLAAAALLAACVVTAALRSPSWPASVAWAALLLLPVLLPLPGIVRGRPRSFAWATLCVAPYFLYGLTEVIANPAVRATAGAILFASLAWFASLVYGLRSAVPSGPDDRSAPPG
jgi:uncharacterized membrane protein